MQTIIEYSCKPLIAIILMPVMKAQRMPEMQVCTYRSNYKDTTLSVE
jgi:hypothetical protein